MKKPLFTPTETKILKMCLVDDDRVQQHHAYLFNCHNLADVVQHLRRKLRRHFNVSHHVVKDNLKTDYRPIVKKDGKKTRIGIYRLSQEWKNEVSQWLQYEAQESQN